MKVFKTVKRRDVAQETQFLGLKIRFCKICALQEPALPHIIRLSMNGRSMVTLSIFTAPAFAYVPCLIMKIVHLTAIILQINFPNRNLWLKRDGGACSAINSILVENHIQPDDVQQVVALKAKIERGSLQALLPIAFH